MSGPSRTIPRTLGLAGPSRQTVRTTAPQRHSSSSSSSSSSSPPPLHAAILLSRPPLLTPTPTTLETTYHAYNSRLRSALSNPVPTGFYFKAGSLPLRRFQRAAHESDLASFGERLAGKTPDVGDLPVESPVEVVPRDHWAKEDANKGRGEKSLERMPEEEVFCLVQEQEGKGKEGKWRFPKTEVRRGEGLDEAVRRGLVGVEGDLGGKGMDSWLVARKPVGVIREGEERVSLFRKIEVLVIEAGTSSHAGCDASPPCKQLLPHGSIAGEGDRSHGSPHAEPDTFHPSSRWLNSTFFLRAHILSGQPGPLPSSPYSTWAWLTPSEIQERLSAQGEEKVWQAVRGMFGLSESESTEGKHEKE